MRRELPEDNQVRLKWAAILMRNRVLDVVEDEMSRALRGVGSKLECPLPEPLVLHFAQGHTEHPGLQRRLLLSGPVSRWLSHL